MTDHRRRRRRRGLRPRRGRRARARDDAERDLRALRTAAPQARGEGSGPRPGDREGDRRAPRRPRRGRRREVHARCQRTLKVAPVQLPHDEKTPHRILPRLLAIVAVLVAVVAGAGIAQAALNDAPKPDSQAARPRRSSTPLNAPPVDGVTARIEFTNNLLPSGSLPENTASPDPDRRRRASVAGRTTAGCDSSCSPPTVTRRSSPTASASCSTTPALEDRLHRLAPRRARQARDRPQADARSTASVQGSPSSASCGRCPAPRRPRPPTGRATRSGSRPKDDGGLLGAAELAWDAVRGVPLRAAIYAQGTRGPGARARGDRDLLRRDPGRSRSTPRRPRAPR